MWMGDAVATDQLTLGEALKERGMALAAGAESPDWKGAEAIALLARGGEDFTAEDVRALAGDPSHPNALGAALNAAARKGLIVCVGRIKAERPSRHANEVRLWRGR